MADGVALNVGQALIPYNSSQALAVIPSQRLYIPSVAPPAGAMNSAALTDNLSLAGATLQTEAYLQDNSFTRALDRYAGTNLVQAANTQAAVRQAAVQAANGATVTQAMVGSVSSAVAEVQATQIANQTSNQGEFGFQSVDYCTGTIWNWSTSQNWYDITIAQLNNAAAGGSIVMSQSLLRLQSSVDFLVWYVDALQSQGFYDVEWLNGVSDSGLIASGMSILDYLNSVYPQYPWQENQDGTGLIGMAWTSGTDSITRSYYWSPRPPSLYDIFHLWDYTPSSGGPVRNGITDFMQIISTLPFTY